MAVVQVRRVLQCGVCGTLKTEGETLIHTDPRSGHGCPLKYRDEVWYDIYGQTKSWRRAHLFSIHVMRQSIWSRSSVR